MTSQLQTLRLPVSFTSLHNPISISHHRTVTCCKHRNNIAFRNSKSSTSRTQVIAFICFQLPTSLFSKATNPTLRRRLQTLPTTRVTCAALSHGAGHNFGCCQDTPQDQTLRRRLHMRSIFTDTTVSLCNMTQCHNSIIGQEWKVRPYLRQVTCQRKQRLRQP